MCSDPEGDLALPSDVSSVGALDANAADADPSLDDTSIADSDLGALQEAEASCGVVCTPSQVMCDEECVDLLTNRAHCGACGLACEPGQVCDGAGSCEASCQAGFQDCDGRCVDIRSDSANCGACDAGCDPGYFCDGSGLCALTCVAGSIICDDMCVDPDSTRAHCGGCWRPCDDGYACVDGACEPSCMTTTKWCGSACVDLMRDPWNCGACDEPCKSDEACIAGVCRLEPLGLSGIYPDHGFYPGGLEVELAGSGFDAATSATIGELPCAELELLSSTRLRCVVPTGLPGLADVRVANDRGQRALLINSFGYDDFTEVSTIAGTGVVGSADGSGDVAQFSAALNSIKVYGDTMYVADGANYKMRAIDLSGLDRKAPDPADVQVSTVAGTGVKGKADATTGAAVSFQQIDDIGPMIGAWIYVSDSDWYDYPYYASTIRRVNVNTGATETLYGGADGFSSLWWDGDDHLYASECGCTLNTVMRFDLVTDSMIHFAGREGGFGDLDGVGNNALLDCPYGLAGSSESGFLYVTDWKNQKVKRIDLSTRRVTTIAGNGNIGYADATAGANAEFNYPNKLAMAGDLLFVPDMYNCLIRTVNVVTSEVGTIAGLPGVCVKQDGPIDSATFTNVAGIVYDPRFGLFVTSTNWNWTTGPTSSVVRLIH